MLVVVAVLVVKRGGGVRGPFLGGGSRRGAWRQGQSLGLDVMVNPTGGFEKGGFSFLAKGLREGRLLVSRKGVI